MITERDEYYIKVRGKSLYRNVRDLNFEFQRSIHFEILRIFEEFDNVLRDGFDSQVSAANRNRLRPTALTTPSICGTSV
jgi:BMFP domain-containing protein YqiC